MWEKKCKCNLFSDHLKNGTPRLYVLLGLLYLSMINHGYCPGEMLFGVMVPLPKVKGMIIELSLLVVLLVNY